MGLRPEPVSGDLTVDYDLGGGTDVLDEEGVGGGTGPESPAIG